MVDFYENRIDRGSSHLREDVLNEPDHADFAFALAQVSARAERYAEAADSYQRFLLLSRDTDDERRERIRGLIAFLRFLGNRESLYSSAGSRSTQIPFDLVGNRPVLKVKVNGRSEPLNFVLDTGSGISVISDETAKRLRIKPITRGGFAKGIGGDGKFEIIYGFLRQLEIGDVRVRHVPVYIRKFHSVGAKVDGYIGLAVISKFLTTVDYGTSTFALDRSDAVMTAASENTRSLPLRLTSSGFLSGEVAVDGIESPVNFIVDTGASVSVISREIAALDSMRANESSQRMRVVGAAGITEDVRSFLIPKISFGDHSRFKIVAVALDLELINEASGFEQGGILGGNFLKNYRLTFDFRNAKVLFDPIDETRAIRPSARIIMKLVFISKRRFRCILIWRFLPRSNDPWFDKEHGEYDVYSSDLVVRELEHLSEPHRSGYLNLIKPFAQLSVSEEVAILAEGYISRGIFHRKFMADAIHVALASYHKVDYFVTWNFGHLANVRKQGSHSPLQHGCGSFHPL